MVVARQEDIDPAVLREVPGVVVRRGEGRVAGIGFAAERKFQVGHGDVGRFEGRCETLQEGVAVVFQLLGMHHYIADDGHFDGIGTVEAFRERDLILLGEVSDFLPAEAQREEEQQKYEA